MLFILDNFALEFEILLMFSPRNLSKHNQSYLPMLQLTNIGKRNFTEIGEEIIFITQPPLQKITHLQPHVFPLTHINNGSVTPS